MKKIKNLLLVLVVTTFALSGCKKYEDGPSFTLKSAKARMVNDWKLDKVYSIDGTTDYTLFFSSSSWELDLSSDYSMTQTVDGVTYTGTWAFSDEKDSLKLTYSGSTFSAYILKLESNDLWLKDDDDDIQLHFISK